MQLSLHQKRKRPILSGYEEAPPTMQASGFPPPEEFTMDPKVYLKGLERVEVRYSREEPAGIYDD